MSHYVYLIQQVNSPYVKIGISNKPTRRVRELQRKNPNRIAIKYVLTINNSSDASYIEAELHREFGQDRLFGEWFAADVEAVLDVLYSRSDLAERVCEVTEYPNWVIDPKKQRKIDIQFRMPHFSILDRAYFVFLSSFIIAQVMLIGGISGNYDLKLYELILYLIIEVSSVCGMIALAAQKVIKSS